MKYKAEDRMVADVLSQHSVEISEKLHQLRALIVKTAQSLDAIGELVETLRWGQLSFVTKNPRTGTTIRIDADKKQTRQYAMYFHCQTTLVETFRQMYPAQFTFAGNRALIFDLKDNIPEKQLSHCIALALTYHLNK